MVDITELNLIAYTSVDIIIKNDETLKFYFLNFSTNGFHTLKFKISQLFDLKLYSYNEKVTHEYFYSCANNTPMCGSKVIAYSVVTLGSTKGEKTCYLSYYNSIHL